VAQEWRDDPNVVGVGFGVKIRGGEWVPGPTLRFTVRDKYATDEEIRAASSRPIPEQIEGVATDVVVIEATPSNLPTGSRGTHIEEPLKGGTSTAVLGGFLSFPTGYGTLGGVCIHNGDDKLMALSNAHVWGFDLGNDIVQPFIPVGEFVEAGVKLLTCGPVISFLSEGRPPSGLTTVLTAAAEAAWIAAAASDVKDPHRRGEEGTPPAQPGELTTSEAVRFSAEPDGVPLPGAPFEADVAFEFERRTDLATYPFTVTERVANEHVLVRRRIFTDQPSYAPGRTVEILALVETASADRPDAFHVVAHLSPTADPDRRVTRVLHPTTCERIPFQCTGFPGHEPDEPATFPFEEDGLTFQARQPGVFRDRWPLDAPDGEIELQFPGLLEIDIPASTRADVRLVQFTSDQIVLLGLDAEGTVVDQAVTPGTQGVEHVLTVRGPRLERLVLRGGHNEALLLEVCRTPLDIIELRAVNPDNRIFCYRGRYTLDPDEPKGSWGALLSVQTVNTVPPGVPAADAAQTIGGIESAPIASTSAACVIVLALDELFDVI
jgi:hypothetical protein